MKSLLAASVAIAALLLPAVAAAADPWSGVHPYDRPERMTHGNSHRNNKRTWGYSEIRRFYASRYRTYTHMLHPYYRSSPGQQFGRVPDNQFRYPYGYFAEEVIRPDRTY